jgi:hypothetical protein
MVGVDSDPLQLGDVTGHAHRDVAGDQSVLAGHEVVDRRQLAGDPLLDQRR